MSPYSAAKGAIIALTHALTFEFAEKNMKVNCVCLGITDATGVWSSVSEGCIESLHMSREDVIKKFTAKIFLGRLTAIEDLVELVYFLTVFMTIIAPVRRIMSPVDEKCTDSIDD